jgi:hypothetical protein
VGLGVAGFGVTGFCLGSREEGREGGLDRKARRRGPGKRRKETGGELERKRGSARRERSQTGKERRESEDNQRRSGQRGARSQPGTAGMKQSDRSVRAKNYQISIQSYIVRTAWPEA